MINAEKLRYEDPFFIQLSLFLNESCATFFSENTREYILSPLNTNIFVFNKYIKEFINKHF